MKTKLVIVVNMLSLSFAESDDVLNREYSKRLKVPYDVRVQCL